MTDKHEKEAAEQEAFGKWEHDAAVAWAPEYNLRVEALCWSAFEAGVKFGRAALTASEAKAAPLPDERIIAAVPAASGTGRVSLTWINNDGIQKPTDVAKRFAAYLLSQAAPPAPDGHVIVPKRPTQAMCDAFNLGIEYLTFGDCYARMIAAAPSAPQQEPVAAQPRHELQADGKHPAPCARFCEANAFNIEIRSLKAQLERAQAAPSVPDEQAATRMTDDFDSRHPVDSSPHRCPTCGVRQRSVAPDSPLMAAHWQAVASVQAAPSVSADPPSPQERSKKMMTIEYQRMGRCFWHIGCTGNRHSSPMRIISHAENASVLECASCGQRGAYPVGSVGSVTVEVIEQEKKQ